MATYEEEQKTLLNNNQWQNWQNNSVAKAIKQANNGAIFKNAVAKQDYVNKLKSKNTAIRPYYYQQGSQYGLDKNAIDRLFGYDEGTGRVSFDGEDLGKPVVEDNGTSYWDETYLSNKWNDFVKKNGLNKIGAKSQNNSTVTEGFRPYGDVNNIFKQKQNWASAAARGDTAGQNAAANAAQTFYNSLRENGYGSVADELEAADGSDDFARKYYGMIGLVPFRDYLYQKGAADGFSKSDIDKLIAYNDVTGEVSFNGQNLGKPLSEINGTSYWQSGDLDKYYQNYIDNGGGALMSPEAKYNKFIDTSYKETTENRNNSEAEEKQLRGYYDNLVKQVLGGLDGVDVAKNASESKDYQNAFKATMAKYDLSALQGRDNAAASAAASNGGNIDSYAAANAMRQQAALTAEGLAAASQMGLDAYNASLNAYNSRVDRVKEILSDLGVRNDSAANIRRGYTQDRNNLAQMVFDNDQTAQNNDVERKRSISEVTGYAPREWTDRDNIFLNEDGSLKEEYLTDEFDNAGGFQDIINKARERGDKETEQQVMYARGKKIYGNYGKYGIYDNGDVIVSSRQKTEDARQFDEQLASAERISNSETELERERIKSEERMNENDNATTRYATDAELAAATANAAKSGGSSGSGGKSGGSSGSSGSSGSGITQSNASKNLLLWLDWANGDENEKEFKWSSKGVLTYVGIDDYNHKKELLEAALRDTNLSQAEKDLISSTMNSQAVVQGANEANSSGGTDEMSSAEIAQKATALKDRRALAGAMKSSSQVLSEFFKPLNISGATAIAIARQAGFSNNEIQEWANYSPWAK